VAGRWRHWPLASLADGCWVDAAADRPYKGALSRAAKRVASGGAGALTSGGCLARAVTLLALISINKFNKRRSTKCGWISIVLEGKPKLQHLQFADVTDRDLVGRPLVCEEEHRR
jgi:hypothetical protein